MIVKTQSIFIFVLLMLQPVIGLLYYYFKIPGLQLVNLGAYILTATFLLFFVKSRRLLLFVFALLLLSLSTLFNLVGNGIEINSLLKQSVLVISFLTILFYGYKINIYKVLSDNKKWIYRFILLDISVILFFKVNPFNYALYGSFESLYLLPTYIYSLVTFNPLLIALHLFSIVLHDKRMVTIIAFLMFVVFMIFYGKASYKKITMFILMLLALVFLYWSGFFDRLINVVTALYSMDLRVLGTISERVDEATAVIGNTGSFYEFMLGKGLGWNFYILNADGEQVYKNFSHNSFVFIYGLLGVFGVFLYLYLHLKYLMRKSKKFVCNETEVSFYKILVLAFLLVSVSVLSPFTSVFNALVLSYVLTNEKFK